MIEIHVKSRLNFCVARILDSVEAWDLLILPPIPVQADDELILVQGGDKLTTLAFKYYGTPVLWWVLALANEIELWVVDIYPNLQLRVPSPRYVEQLLFREVRQRRRAQ